MKYTAATRMGIDSKPMSGAAVPTAILVVEDEFLVRLFAVDVLEDAGFRVLQAGSADEAMQMLRAGTDVRAALIDMGLPDRPGDALAAEIQALRPDLPIVICSGRSGRELRERFDGNQRVAILVKPYTAPLLIELLAELGVAAATA